MGGHGNGIVDRLRGMEAGKVLRGVMGAFAAAFLLAAFIAPDRADMLPGFVRILTGPAQLTRDWFLTELGGMSATMLNAALVGAACCGMMFLPGAKVNGATVLGYFLTLGFALFGINALNMLPPVLGTLLYAKLTRQRFGSCVNAAMFSTGLAPLISEALFRYPDATVTHGATLAGVLLAVILGAIIGMMMPPLCGQSTAFHKGFNLYNAGPAAGFLGALLFAGMYKVRGLEAPAIGATLGEGAPLFVNAFYIATFGLCAVFGFLLCGGVRPYGKLLRDSGYRADFTAKYGAGPCVMNLGVYGLFTLAYYNIVGARFTGVTMGVVICMASACCNGATPLNALPVLLGYGAMGLLNRLGLVALSVDSQALVVGLCFASGLAPVSGVYGPLAGVAAGIIHFCLVTNMPAIHGGFNLYNGGFTSGVAAFILVPALERFSRKGPADRR